MVSSYVLDMLCVWDAAYSSKCHILSIVCTVHVCTLCTCVYVSQCMFLEVKYANFLVENPGGEQNLPFPGRWLT